MAKKKTMTQVIQIVMAYGGLPRNKWFDDPKGDQNVEITPAIAKLSENDFDLFFVDFTHYIRVENDMAGVIMTSFGLINCTFWADLVGYVFDQQ